MLGIYFRNRCALLLSLVTLWTITTVTIAASNTDLGEDFQGHFEELERRDQEAREYAAKLSAHEEWRQTTWGGFCVRQIQALGKKFEPFLEAVQDALDETQRNDSPSSLSKIAIYLGIRMVFVLGVLTMVYIGAKILQLLVGNDYEIVEEVVVIHEHDTEEEAAKARAKTTRGKKQKSS